MTLTRDLVLAQVAENGEDLGKLAEEYRRDPDVVLAALGSDPGAWKYADEALQESRDFQFEAVLRSWRVLELLPQSAQTDRDILLAAAKQNPKALSSAQNKLVNDDVFVQALKNYGKGPARYEGECVRLVGHCNHWRTTDKSLRFRKVTEEDCPEGTEPPAPGATRHELVLNLKTGVVSFQVVSCTRAFALRVYPSKLSDDGFYKVAKGGGRATRANIGGSNDGHGRNFYIKEKPDTIVRVNVEFNRKGDEASVWYVRQKDMGGETPVFTKAVSVSQGPKKEKPNMAQKASGHIKPDDLDVCPDVSFRGEFKDLIMQARTLSAHCFNERFSISSLNDDKQIVLMANKSRTAAGGYMIYSVDNKKGILRIDEVAVVEKLRSKGLGKRMLRWAITYAEESGLRALVGSGGQAVGRFLNPHGFLEDPNEKGRFVFTLKADAAEGDKSKALGVTPKPAWFFEESRGRSASPPSGKSGNVRILIFLGSHITSKDRCNKFADTLASIADQKQAGAPELFVSWSAPTVELRSETRALLSRAFNEGMPGLRAAEQTSNMSQFQHFMACMRGSQSTMKQGTWLIFSDDDDIWHPRRLHEYQEAIKEVQNDRTKYVVGATRHGMLKTEPEFPVKWATDVDHLLGQGSKVGRLSDATAFLKRADVEEGISRAKVKKPSRKDAPYYFDLAIRSEQFANFLMRTPTKIVDCKFCDRRFLSHFCNYSSSGPVHWFDPESWLYFYTSAPEPSRVTPMDYAANSGNWDQSVTAVDYDMAEHELKKLRAKADRYKYATVDRMGVEGMSRLVANLRASLELAICSLSSIDYNTADDHDLRKARKQAVRSCFVCREPGSGAIYTYVHRLAAKIQNEVTSDMNIKVIAHGVKAPESLPKGRFL